MANRFCAYILTSLAAVSFLAAPTLAQDTRAAAEPDDKAPCELHIWAAKDFASMPFGHGLGELAFHFPGNLDETSDQQFVDIASANLQIEAVLRADPVASLGLPAGTAVVTHLETEDERSIKQRKERRSTSQATCYYELHMGSNYLIEDIVWGDRFTTTFDVRQYRDDAQWVFRHRGEGANKLTVFPVKEEDDPAEVISKVSEAIEANFVEYAPKAKRNLERKSRRR
ncbi:hypothetical protein CHX26_06680 [Porphyrobacter sp. HT-58-2]|uniref:hypothetical protein n=1 Tax=Porphyrobacter sp. HT-58-2 TaxID=2023229 RepID=UPI000CDC314F|nr:hypothetical protein [Porphyrobacter sp. HT-58-2]AUX69222.1 hypothetical protein CHX26_06680 [Porphyrobacter sp. HT-58-2]